MTEEGPSTLDDGPAEKDSPPDVIDAATLGRRLGRYQLVLPLARGGMGLVFAGRLVGPHGVERLVAIKTLRPITSANDRAALLREAKLTSRLHHRNVVATLDLGEVDDVPYVVMELVDGIPLSRLVSDLEKNGDRLAPEVAAWIVAQAALGLHAAHELADPDGRALGLVHRDVSPQNILLSVQGEVKIADFGIAKFAGREESTATGMIKGKFAYMSPEQAGSGTLDRRSDVFALGIVLWEALTGERLFSAETPARTMLRVLEHKPRSPLDVRAEVGPELAAIAMRCLARDPDERYATAADVADALRAALRARGSHVDEGDLSALVKKRFGEECERTMDRIRTATEATSNVVPGPSEPSAVGVSLTTEARTLLRSSTPPRRSSVLVAGLAIGLLAIVGVAWTFVKGAEAPGANANATASAATSANATVSANATATATPAATATATPTANANANATPTATGNATPTATPSATARGIATGMRPPARGSATPAPRASDVPTASAPAAPKPSAPRPAASVGQPFESL